MVASDSVFLDIPLQNAFARSNDKIERDEAPVGLLACSAERLRREISNERRPFVRLLRWLGEEDL